MTPKEKANKLCMRFLIQTTTDIPYGVNKTIAKECALIAVVEILTIFYDDTKDMWIDEIEYWHNVKKEIEAL